MDVALRQESRRAQALLVTRRILSPLKASKARLELLESQFRLEFRVYAAQRRGGVAA